MTKGDIDRPRIMVDIMGKNRRTRLGMVPVTYFILKKLRYNVEKMTIRKSKCTNKSFLRIFGNFNMKINQKKIIYRYIYNT